MINKAKIKHWDIVGLMLIIAASSVLLLNNLGSGYISLWDEVTHVNVVKNLANNCCTPKLHLQNYNTDYRNWTDNYIWLHKPPFPFYINAAFFATLGKNLWAFRFPSFLFVELIVILLFWIGKKFLGVWPALLGAALFAFNHYTFELVQGRQFSGFSDILLLFFLMWSLYLIFKISENPQKKYFLLFGLSSGLAFLCKDGLTLVPFLVLMIIVVRLGFKKYLPFLLYGGLVTLVIIAPEKIYLATRFPAESTYEQQQQLAHLWANIEYWGRPWDYYLSYYYTVLMGPLLAGAGYLALVYGIFKARMDIKFLILSAWVLCYLIPLTFTVSKISNFIYPIVPVLCLLIGYTIFKLWENKNFLPLIAGALSMLISQIFLSFNFFKSQSWLLEGAHWYNRFTLAGFEMGLFAILFLLIKTLPLLPKLAKKDAAVFFSAAAILIILTSSAHANFVSSNQKQPDYNSQIALRQAALALPAKLPPGSLVLVNWPEIDKSHLFVKYWSGLEAFEIYYYHPAWDWLNLLKGHKNIYLLSQTPASKYGKPISTDNGYLYKLR